MSLRLLDIEFSKVIENENKVKKMYGFKFNDIAYIVKCKPSFLLYEEEYASKKKGLLALDKVLI